MIHSKSVALFFLIPSLAMAQPIQVELDGRSLQFDQPPVSVEGRLMVPLRGIFEALQADVVYTPSTRSIKATKGSTLVELTLGSREGRVNGSPVYLDVPANTLGGRTMVPLRFVSESLGAEVKWNGATRTVLLSAGGAGSVEPPPSGAKPKLDQVIHNGTRNLKVGDSLDVVLVGEAGAQASWEILGALRPQSLSEVSPGRYEGRFTIPNGLNVERGVIIGHLSRGGQESVLESTRTLSIRSGGPVQTDSLVMEPQPNSQVSSSRPLVRLVFPEDIRSNTFRLYLDQIDVSRQVSLVNAREIQFRPQFDLQQGQHQIEAQASSVSGQRHNPRWTFDVGQSSGQSLPTLEPAEGQTIQNTRPRIGASFGRPVNNWRLVIDGTDFTQAASQNSQQISWTPLYDISPGQHQVEVTAYDSQNQRLQRNWTFTVGAASNQIETVFFNTSSGVTGQNIQVESRGPSGAQATFSLASRRNLSMSEVSPGRYVGNYPVQNQDRGNYQAEVLLRLPGGAVLQRLSDSSIILNQAAQNALTLENLVDGSVVPVQLTLMGSATPGTNLAVVVSYQKQDVVSVLTGQRVEFTVNGQADGNGRYQIPVHLGSVPSRTQASIRVTDLSNNSSQTRTVQRQ